MDNGAGSYRRFLNGEESAFDEIMQAYFHSLVFFIDRYVHDVSTAEDIAMDVFVELIVHKHRYNFQVTLKAYLFMLGRSRALDWLKHQRVLQFTDLSQVPELSDDSLALEEQLAWDEKKRAVDRAIRTLPEDMQTAVYLVYFEQLSYEQAAKVMKKNRKQVDNLLYRAKKALRGLLEKDGEQLC